MLNRSSKIYPRKYKVTPGTAYDTAMVFAAAVKAQAINGEYVNRNWRPASSDDVMKPMNKWLMKYILNPDNTDYPESIEYITRAVEDHNIAITEEDIEAGNRIREYYMSYTAKIFDGTANDFDKSVINTVISETINDRSDAFGLISYLIGKYEKDILRDKQEENKMNLISQCVPFDAPLNSKVSITIEVLSCHYSNTWMTYVINAKTNVNNGHSMIFFCLKNSLEIGKTYKIEGSVKNSCPTSTKLNRVKVK